MLCPFAKSLICDYYVKLRIKSDSLRFAHLRYSCSPIWVTYSYLHTSLANLTGAPRHQYYFGVGCDVSHGFHVDAELKGVSGLFVADDVATQNYATVNLRFSYRVIRSLQLFVNLDNVTDANYEINKGYTMPGFTAMGGFKLML